MNNSSKPLILGALLILTAVLTIIYSQSNRSSATELSLVIGTEPLHSMNMAKVKAITIREGDNQLDLKQVDGQWQLIQRGSYPADEGTVERLIVNLRNMKVLRTASASERQLSELSLGKNEGVTVELKDSTDKVIHTLQLGKEISGPPPAIQTSMNIEDRRFLMIDGKPESIAVVDQTFDSAGRELKDWLNKDFFEIENPTSVAVNFSGDSNSSWSINQWDDNGTKKWRVSDLNATSQPPENNLPTTAFSSASFDDVVDKEVAKELDTNATRIQVNTKDGFQYAIRVKARLIQGDYLLKMDVNATITATDEARKKELTEKLAKEQALNRVYLVPAHVVEPVIKTREALLAAEPPSSPGPGGGSPIIPPLNGFPPRPN